ncbi:MAG: 50S ribosome-binding GTPase, partial [Krumholzibacteria bacterium]|nr:50S ribosome-binding GTPase [Candidatus Krumholzibacteria bacterium]
VLDEVLLVSMRAPATYTREDVVEVHCHGGVAAQRAVLRLFCRLGARPAEPGEFTRRAFLHGKLSLDQAEAVADLIAAEGEQVARGALNQLRGGLARELAAVEAPLLDLLARLEGSFEFLDEEGMGPAPAAVAAELATAVLGIDRLLAMAPAGRLLRDGVEVVLSGPVNAGKSALFNALLGQERAIVDDEAGTTRDVVSARVVRGGTVYVLHDTAGLRDDPGRVESKGIARTRRQVAEADIVLAVDDGAAAAPPPGRAAVIAVRSKCDLGGPTAEGTLATSAVTGEGVEALWAAIDAAVGRLRLGDAVALGVVLNERHAARLSECRGDLADLAALAGQDPPAGDEVLGSMLASILARLGEVSGRVFSEQLLNTVFKKFCVGK